MQQYRYGLKMPYPQLKFSAKSHLMGHSLKPVVNVSEKDTQPDLDM